VLFLGRDLRGCRSPCRGRSRDRLVLGGNTLLRPLVNWINRRPITEGATEAHYRVYATCNRPNVADVRDLLDELLSRASYPVREVEIMSESESQSNLRPISFLRLQTLPS
jgi:putative Mg2+ transporter-C (MgtC) family protein